MELAAHVPLVVNLTRDTHRVSYDYATEMCAEIRWSGRVYKPTALVAKPSRLEPTPLPASQPPSPTIEETSTKATSSITKKDQPIVDITT